ncbi:MAG: TolC family protein, partial [Cyclobacteriaceae bacterium]|nr:TolC family protein [Cyclobacteriaceae bacterium]
MKKLLFILTIGASAIYFPVFSQDTVRISKSELLGYVQTNNFQIRIAYQQVKMANADYRQSKALFLPSLSASHTAMVTTNPLMAFGSKLNQEILTQADFDPARLNNPDRTENYATEFSLLQPLLNLDGVYERQAAKIQQEAYQLKSERNKEYLELEAAKTYMQLQLAYEAVEVLERAQTTSQQGVKMVTDYFDEGLLQKSDVLYVEVRATEVENHEIKKKLKFFTSINESPAIKIKLSRYNVRNDMLNAKSLIATTPGVDLVFCEYLAYNNARKENAPHKTYEDTTH